MPEEPRSREEQVETLLNEAVLARLATSNAKTNQPHVVPVWFLWDGECLWISAFTSTRKAKDLLGNPRCAVLIEPRQEISGQIGAVLFEGTAELIRAPHPLVAEISTKIYTRYMGAEGVLAPEPQSWIVDPENMLVRLKPEKRFVW